MNKIIATYCFLTASLCFAQAPDNQQPPPESSAPAEASQIVPVPAAEPPPPAPIPVAPAPAAPTPVAPVSAVPVPIAPATPAPATPVSSEKSILNALRGHVYNPYGIAGAATSVTDLIGNPSEIHGQKFFYVSPDNLGFAAFDLGGSSMLVGLHNSGYLGALILGYATQDFGVTLDYSVGKAWIQFEDYYGVTTSYRGTDYGDNIGLHFSLPGGLYANARWFTYDSYFVEQEGNSSKNYDGEYSVNDSYLEASVGMRSNLGAVQYDASLNVYRYGISATNTIPYYDGREGEKAVDEDTHTGLSISFDLGYVILPNETTRIIIGSNNRVTVRFYDEIGDIAAYGSMVMARIMPNILGEVALSDNLLAFAGAAQPLFLTANGGEALREKDFFSLEIMQNPTNAFFIGMRYQKANWAVETRVSDNPFAAFAGNQILTQLGGFIYF